METQQTDTWPEEKKEQELQLTAERMGITVQKLAAMRAYAYNLARSDKKMKTSTIRRKVCEKFKIKLV